MEVKDRRSYVWNTGLVCTLDEGFLFPTRVGSKVCRLAKVGSR